jgi:hypothetical protein
MEVSGHTYASATLLRGRENLTQIAKGGGFSSTIPQQNFVWISNSLITRC